MSLLDSLAAKLTLAFLVVGIAGALLVATLVRWQTQQQFDRFIQDWYGEEIAVLQEQLQAYYEREGSWEGIRAVVIRNEPNSVGGPGGPGQGGGGGGPGGKGRRGSGPARLLTLVDAGGTVVSEGPRGEVGTRLPETVFEKGAPIEVGGAPVGWLLLDGREQLPANAPENAFLANVSRATLWSALGAAALALLVGGILAQTIARPLHDLTAATQAMTRGELGQQVPVRTRDEIGTLAVAFNRMSADLARATALRRQMTADIAHDLRSPLSALLGYTEALHEGKFTGSPGIYALLHQEAQQLQRLIEDLRLLSLADAGELPLQPEPTDPKALLERVALAWRPQAEQQGIALSVQVEPTLPLATLDPQRIVQVLANLVQNALRHTPRGGTVRLLADRHAGQLRLQVSDSGSGIPADELPFIWERSFRGDKARRHDGSSGLGLAIARSLIEAHHGIISVVSPPGEGATFTILLPLESAA